MPPPRKPPKRAAVRPPGGRRRRPRRTAREWVEGDAAERKSLEEVEALIKRFQGADTGDLIRRIKMSGIDLARDLQGANLRGVDLYGLELNGANLRGADLRQADLTGTHMKGADLSEAALAQARLEDAVLSEATLAGADLRATNLRDAYLVGADLTGADLTDCMLLGADLSGAHLDEPLFDLPELLRNPARVLNPVTLAAAPDPSDPESARALQDQVAEGDDRPRRPMALGPLGQSILIAGFQNAICNATLLKACGIDPGALSGKDLMSPLVAFVLYSNEGLFRVVDGTRRDLIIERRAATRAGERARIAQINLVLAGLHQIGRGYPEAEQNLDDAQAYFEAIGERARLAEIIAKRGALALERIDHLNAVRHFRDSLERHEQSGDGDGRAAMFLVLSVLALLHGALPRVDEFLEQAARITPKSDDPTLPLMREAVHGCVLYREGEPAEAVRVWAEARDGFARAGIKGDARVLERLIDVAMLQANKW